MPSEMIGVMLCMKDGRIVEVISKANPNYDSVDEVESGMFARRKAVTLEGRGDSWIVATGPAAPDGTVEEIVFRADDVEQFFYLISPEADKDYDEEGG